MTDDENVYNFLYVVFPLCIIHCLLFSFLVFFAVNRCSQWTAQCVVRHSVWWWHCFHRLWQWALHIFHDCCKF